VTKDLTMRIARFRHLLETLGPDLSRWPAEHAAAARRLVSADPASARELEAARRLEVLLHRHLGEATTDRLNDAADVSLARPGPAFRGPLPPQRRRWLARWWPTELLAFDLAPAWPRVAALAGIAGLGFILGLANPSLPGTRGAISAAGESDLSMMLFEPDPLSGRP